MLKYIVSFDLSLNHGGFCILGNRGKLLSFNHSSVDLKISQLKDNRLLRSEFVIESLFDKAENFLLSNYDYPSTYAVVIEGFSFASRSNNIADIGISYGLLIGKFLYAMEYTPSDISLKISPKTVKKFATGNGNADKFDVINALKTPTKARFEKYINEPKNKIFMHESKSVILSDLADAYFLGQYYFSTKLIDNNKNQPI